MSSDIGQSLDDLIARDTRSGGRRPLPGGRKPATGVVRGGRTAPTRNARTQARQTSAPYSRRSAPAKPRGQVSEDSHLKNTDVRDVAASKNPLLKVSSSSVPNTVAGAICNVVRESRSNEPPSVMATGPQAINQAIKAIAIAKKYLLEEDPPIDLLVQPRFEQDLREGSNVVFLMKKSTPITREPADTDLSAKDGTDCFKLAGAIAGRVRDGEEVSITTKGAIPVLVAVKALALAQDYLADDNIDIKFAVQFRDLEEMGQESTFLHFAILPRNL